ncbi:MAG TPA: hypothetical protein VGO93_25245 [Candidatus Xenobia bacterium]|jgi:hypothetical protein
MLKKLILGVLLAMAVFMALPQPAQADYRHHGHHWHHRRWVTRWCWRHHHRYACGGYWRYW